MNDKEWQACQHMQSAYDLLEYGDPIADVLRALKDNLILRPVRAAVARDRENLRLQAEAALEAAIMREAA